VFTGIIEKTAPVFRIAATPASRRLTLPAPWPDARPGESISVNGCCLTIATLSPTELAFDVIPETLAKTNLGRLQPGDLVNLERALRLGDRMDGHMVQGHIDGVARLLARQDPGGECRLSIESPRELRKYIVPKGSVTVDGVSLTIAAVHAGSFEVALIPTTLSLTTLGSRKPGYEFNLETDILAKTVVFWLEQQEL
jgi:riboflavin synthase